MRTLGLANAVESGKVAVRMSTDS